MSRHELRSEVTGSVWQVLVEVGDEVSEGDTVMILESMKMEIPVLVEDPGRVVELSVAKDDSVAEGQVVAVIDGSTP